MQINVSQQLKGPIGSSRNYHISETIAIEDKDYNIEGDLKLTRTQRSILVEGALHVTLELTCSRCLKLYCCPMTLNIEEEYFPTIDIQSGARLPSPDEPDAFTLDENNILNLTEAIRQYALLTIPMKPLCSQDCAGLCPTCGHNQNEGPCSCQTQAIDPRWSKLIEFK
ncbi:MAG: DUF177 domain-containing protein [Chloroflexota bacterium]